ncbi:MAG: ATP-binding cassette domain-containing protein [Bacteroidota bacterium]
MTMIELKNICLSSKDKIILENISLEIKENMTTVIVGPSGAGKSSILKIVAGLWKPDTGEILFYGRNIFQMTAVEYKIMRKKIGIVFQSNALFDSLSVSENILYFLPERKSLSVEQLKSITEQLLNFVNMEGTGDLYPEELSGGMKKRIAIARALAFNPDLILFDEPTTGLDPINSASIIELIEKLKNNGTTSVVVSHILNDVVELGENIIVLNDGHIVGSGSIEKIIGSGDPFINKFFYQLNKQSVLVKSNKYFERFNV